MNILTIDIGGTEIKSALYQHDGQLLFDFDNQPTLKTATDNRISEQVLAICQKTQSQYNFDGVAIATAGVVNPNTGEVIYAGPTILNYSHTPLKKQIETTLQLPCCVENDVNAVAMGETWLGAAKGYQSVLCLTLGTGLGGALLLDGNLWHGKQFSAGEIGYLIQENGKRLDELASTTALLANYQQKTGEAINGKLFFERVRQGDLHADAALETMLTHLANGLAAAVFLIAPEAIVIGGGIASQKEILEPRLWQALEKQLPNSRFMPTAIHCAMLGNRAGMLGALRCFLNQQQETNNN